MAPFPSPLPFTPLLDIAFDASDPPPWHSGGCFWQEEEEEEEGAKEGALLVEESLLLDPWQCPGARLLGGKLDMHTAELEFFCTVFWPLGQPPRFGL